MVTRGIVCLFWLASFALSSCGRIGFDALDTDGELDVWPTEIRDTWVEAGRTTTYEAIVRETQGASLAALRVEVPQPWATVEILPETIVGERHLRISVKAEVGGYAQSLVVSVDGSEALPVEISLDLSARQTTRFHVGMTADGCPSDEGNACDYVASTGLEQAMTDAGAVSDTRVLVYDAGGALVTYEVCQLSIPADTWLSAAPGVPVNNVIIADREDEADETHMLSLDGNNSRLSGVTLQKRGLCGQGTLTALGSSGHLLENLVIHSSRPEAVGGNTTVTPFDLGDSTTLRNSLITGHFEKMGDMSGSNGIRIVGNTFSFLDAFYGQVEANGATNLVIANNLFLSPIGEDPAFFNTPEATTLGIEMSLTGNVFEGFARMFSDVVPAGVVDSENVFGQVDVESMVVPKWLQGVSASTGSSEPGSGVSLDGIPLGGRTDILPGAYQNRSDRGLPRRMLTRVGDGDCGANLCDVDASATDEIQQAVWESWPGGVIEVYPSLNSYAGRAVVTMPLTIKGMGDVPDDVVLEYRTENLLAEPWATFGANDAILSFSYGTIQPSRVENMSFRGRIGCKAMILTEGAGAGSPVSDHVFTGLRLESQELTTTAFALSDRTRVQDALITGTMLSCVRYGLLRVWGTQRGKHVPTTGSLINVTCRLFGTPESVIDVALVENSTFVNLAVELETPAPLFRAQRRPSGDTGTVAIDAPISFTASALSIRNRASDFFGFTGTAGDFILIDMDTVLDGDDFFVGPSDSHLQTGASAMDKGREPTVLVPTASPGTSIDGVPRAGRMVDRGCYEQGN